MYLQPINFIFAGLKRTNYLIDLVIANNNGITHTVLTSFVGLFNANGIRTVNENFNVFCITHSFNSSSNENNNSTCVHIIKTSAIERLLQKEGF